MMPVSLMFWLFNELSENEVDVGEEDLPPKVLLSELYVSLVEKVPMVGKRAEEEDDEDEEGYPPLPMTGLM